MRNVTGVGRNSLDLESNQRERERERELKSMCSK
jgi:hypothetical protein